MHFLLTRQNIVLVENSVYNIGFFTFVFLLQFHAYNTIEDVVNARSGLMVNLPQEVIFSSAGADIRFF